MATLSLSYTIADDKVAGIKDDFAAYHGWTALINGQTNPETQNAFIKRKVGEFLKESVKAYRANNAASSARNTSLTDSETNVVIT